MTKPNESKSLVHLALIFQFFFFLKQAARRERKENIDREKGRTTQKILQNLLRSHAVKGVTGDRTEHIAVPPSERPAEPDIFQLPPLAEVDRG